MPNIGSAKEPIRITREPEALAPWRKWMLSNLIKIAKAAGAEIQIDGAKSASNSEGAKRFRIDTSGAASQSALYVETNGVVTPSTIGGVMPTIGGTALDAGTPPALTITGSGTEYVIATISGTVSMTTLSSRDFFHTMTGLSVALSVTGTAITSGDSFRSTSPFKLLLATFVDGAKTAQVGYGPIGLSWNDDLTGDGNAQMVSTWTV